mgnify:CR=1 FL=1
MQESTQYKRQRRGARGVCLCGAVIGARGAGHCPATCARPLCKQHDMFAYGTWLLLLVWR